MVRFAVLVRTHADHFVALQLGYKRTADAAIGAGGHDTMFGLSFGDDGFFRQCRGGTRLHARTTGDAFRIQEIGGTGRHLGRKAAALDGERESSLHFLAGAHAARAHDALGSLEGEVWVRLVFRGLEMILPFVAVADFAQPDHACHVLQFAIAVRRAGQTIQRMI